MNLRAEMEIAGVHAKLDTLREHEWAEVLRVQREQLELLRRMEARWLEGQKTGGAAEAQ